MPLLQGEVSLLTVYADVHYFFSAPNAKPPHHRFDKRSYVYLYHDALNRRGRLEIANHAGTPEQDAFDGYLDTADIEFSYKHPTLFTITVQGRILSAGASASSPAPSPAQHDVSKWHLPAHDMRHEARYMYKLHTVDIYVWTADDAGLFLDSLKRVLAPGQLRVLDAGNHPEHRDSMSPVVQQLEKVAITNQYGGQDGAPPGHQQHQQQTQPASQQQLQPQQRSNSISTTHTTHSTSHLGAGTSRTPVSPPSSPPTTTAEQQQQQQQTQPLPPPPSSQPPQQQQQQQSFAPMAYNPAAPMAPEPIAHREKTPPPPDAEHGTGLAAAALHDSQPHTQPYAQGPQGPGVGGMMSFPGPPQIQQQPYTPGMPGPPSSMPPPPTGSAPGSVGPGTGGVTPLHRANTLSPGGMPPPPPPQQQQQQPQPGIPVAGGQAPTSPPPSGSYSSPQQQQMAGYADPAAAQAYAQQHPHLAGAQAGAAQPLPSPGLVRQSTIPPGYPGYAPGAPPQSPGFGGGFAPQHAGPGTYNPGAGQVPQQPQQPGTPGMAPPQMGYGYAGPQGQQQQQVQMQGGGPSQQGGYAPEGLGAGAYAATQHSIHQQVYRPEGMGQEGPGAGVAGPGQAGAVGKLEQRAGKVEKRMKGLWNRLDKHL